MQNKIKRLQKIDHLLFEFRKLYSLSSIYPNNVEEEKKKFFDSETYNPKFEYNDPSINFEQTYKKIKNIKYKNSVMDELLKEKAEEIYNNIKLLENLGKKDFTKYSLEIYGSPSKDLLKRANEIIEKTRNQEVKSKRRISSAKAINLFQKVFRNLNISWKAVEKDIASNALVIPATRTLVLKKGVKYTPRQIRRLIVHEIYTHALRAEFGLRQPYKIFSIGLADYEATEEGLALYKEKRANVLDRKALKRYALRVVAVDKALRSSFRETFNLLSKYMPNENAWELTVRVKRGIKRTERPGAFTKDYSYLKGFFEVSDFIRNQSGLHLLHYGKINTKQALLIPSIEGLRNPFIVLKKHFKKNVHDLSILY